jgi:hypothetical protein
VIEQLQPARVEGQRQDSERRFVTFGALTKSALRSV